ncbi:hypothetical protein ABPG75_002742 [Micractinium tetrahymenae]
MGQKREREGEKRGYSRLPAETLQYFEEVAGRLKELDDDEERQLLADNALGEADSAVATDAACSRVVEALLPHASISVLGTFAKAVVEGESLGAMCTSGPFGSHVLEKVLLELGRRVPHAGDGDYEEIEGTLTAVTEAAAASLYEMATSKYGSFVARRLLCVLAGRDVAPPPGKKPSAAPAADEGSGAAAAPAAATAAGAAPPSGPRGGGALAAKLRAGGEGEGGGASLAGSGADYPVLLDTLAAVVLGDEWSGEEMQRLAGDSFAGPFLQALLRACTHNHKLQQRLLLRVLGGAGSKGVESVSMERCHALMQDRNGSHLMEAVFSTAPDDYFAKLTTLCFKGHLLPLAQHPCANFAVQAALAALRKPQQLKRMFEDLKPSFHQLLRSRRSGVLAALLAAAGRLGTQEAEASAALWAAAGEGAKSGSPLEALLTLDTTTQLGSGGRRRRRSAQQSLRRKSGSPLEALLTLDTTTQLGSGGRLSTLGCAMLGTLLRLPPAACKQWADALAALPPGKLQHAAKDPGGCRVLEAYLEGPGAAAKKRRALLAGLAGAYGEVALGGSGSHFVEKCYALAEVEEKELIAGELAAAEARLMATHRGPLLLKRCHVEAFKKGSEGWQKRVAAADAVRREFEDLFGEADAAAEAAAAQAVASRQQGTAEAASNDDDEEEGEEGGAEGGAAAATAAAAAAEEEGQEEEEEERPKKRKKAGKEKGVKKAKAASASPTAEAAAGAAANVQQAVAAPTGGGKEKKQQKGKDKGRRQEGQAAQGAVPAVEQQQGVPAEPAAKKEKKKRKKVSA